MHARFRWGPLQSWSCATVGALGLLFLAMTPRPVAAQGEPAVIDRVSAERVIGDWKDCGLRKIDEDAFVSHRVPAAKQNASTATIEVEYGDGFTSDAQEAFQRAVDIWETRIASPVPIRIEARFVSLPENELGGARSNLLYAVDTNRDDQIDTVYGDALVDARFAEDQNPSDSDNANPPDIVASFNSAREDWHFGEGDAPAGTIDFSTVVLHEITHGLNYFDIFDYEEGVGEYGHDWDGDGTVDDDERFAGVYGQRLVREQMSGPFLSVTDRSVYPVPSEAFGDVLTSDRLLFDGPGSRKGASESEGPATPKVYAPPGFIDGSSIAHLDESTYEVETENALMTPNIERAETIRLPGPIVCGQLADLGWTLGPECAFENASIVTDAEAEVDPANQGTVDLTWQFTGNAPVERFIIERHFFGTPQQRTSVPAGGTGEQSATLEGLQVGDHTFRLSYVTPDSVAVQVGSPVTVTVPARQPDVSVYPNPFTDVAKISFVLPEEQRVRVEVFDVLGRHVSTPFVGQRPANDARPVVFDAGHIPNLSSGHYFFRVSGETFRETVKAIHVR